MIPSHVETDHKRVNIPLILSQKPLSLLNQLEADITVDVKYVIARMDGVTHTHKHTCAETMQAHLGMRCQLVVNGEVVSAELNTFLVSVL